MRRAIAAMLMFHGLIHFTGVGKAFDLSNPNGLTDSISRPLGVAWMFAGVWVLVSAVAMWFQWRWWWAIGAGAGIASELVIIAAWSGPWIATVANIVLLLTSLYGYVSREPKPAEHR
jgi:hypothetical protein